VRTHRLLAHGSEPVRAHGRLHRFVARAGRQPSAQPRRLGRGLALAPILTRLDAVLDGRETMRRAVFGAGRNGIGSDGICDDNGNRAERVEDTARLLAHGSSISWFPEGV